MPQLYWGHNRRATMGLRGPHGTCHNDLGATTDVPQCCLGHNGRATRGLRGPHGTCHNDLGATTDVPQCCLGHNGRATMLAGPQWPQWLLCEQCCTWRPKDAHDTVVGMISVPTESPSVGYTPGPTDGS